MTTVKRVGNWATTTAAVALIVGIPHIVAAQVSTEQSASVLFFPKVIADGTWNTTIQLANDANSAVSAECFYLTPAPLALGARTDFTLFLTPQQPTHWLVSAGRPIDVSDVTCSATVSDCNGAGFDPGDVPPAPPNFRGALLCLEVDTGGTPVTGNHLRGLATLSTVSGGVRSKYNAVGVAGNADTAGGLTVCVAGTGRTQTCSPSARYSGCPEAWILTHLADGAQDPLIGAGSAVRTNVTLVPCSHDLTTRSPTQVTAQFVITSELEQTLSASTTIMVWADLPLSSISTAFTRGSLGTDYAQTRITPGGASGGFMVVGQQFDSSGTDSGSASTMLNLHVEGTRTAPDIIIIPAATP